MKNGAKGGSAITDNTHLKGFGTRRDLASTAGSKGGVNSRRGLARRMNGIHEDLRSAAEIQRLKENSHAYQEDLTA